MQCKNCGKPIICDEDWGDYDDATDWTCRCYSYYFDEKLNEVVRFDQRKSE